jgi:hypothetical protein
MDTTSTIEEPIAGHSLGGNSELDAEMQNAVVEDTTIAEESEGSLYSLH